MSFEFIPAIDMLDGKVVRLHKGDYDAVTVFGEDPIAMAKTLEDAGARRLHIVDLDGARHGQPAHAGLIESIANETELSLQIGGGVRSADAAHAWWNAGVERVVFGTAAVKNPEMVRALCGDRPGGVVVALDARNGEVAVEGWLESSGRQVDAMAVEIDSWGAAAILFTAIERDGTGEGPDVSATAALQQRVGTTVIASGGIGSLEHIRALVGAGVRAAVCGKALYSGAFTLEQAFEAAAC